LVIGGDMTELRAKYIFWFLLIGTVFSLVYYAFNLQEAMLEMSNIWLEIYYGVDTILIFIALYAYSYRSKILSYCAVSVIFVNAILSGTISLSEELVLNWDFHTNYELYTTFLLYGIYYSCVLTIIYKLRLKRKIEKFSL